MQGNRVPLLSGHKRGRRPVAPLRPGTSRHPHTAGAGQTAPRSGAHPLMLCVRRANKKPGSFGRSPAALSGSTQIGLCQNEIVFWVVEKRWVNYRAVLPESPLAGKKRFPPQHRRNSVKNAVFCPPRFPAAPKTPFLARFGFPERRKRRFWHDFISGRGPDGGFGTISFPGGLQTAFAAHLDFQQR